MKAKRLLDRNKQKTLEQRREKKWKKFTDRVDHGYFKARDMTQLQMTGQILEELVEEKAKIDVGSIEGIEKKRTYTEVLLKVVTNTIETNSKPKNTDKYKIMEPNILRPIAVFVGTIKLEVGRIFYLQ